MQYYQQVPLGMGIRGGKMYLEEKKGHFSNNYFLINWFNNTTYNRILECL